MMWKMKGFDGLEVRKSGVRLYDELFIEPAEGRRHRRRLDRTRYIFNLQRTTRPDLRGVQITLPSLDSRKGVYSLELVDCLESKDLDQEGRYVLKVIEGGPFKLNGNFCYQSILTRGDRVTIGFNQLVFEKLAENGDQASSELIPLRVKESTLNLLIQGETGTGKGHLAREIHEQSGRNGNFVHINLSAFSYSLIESEVFGHVKGAFTGACNDKLGALREAQNGTLFLDEIDSLSLEMQTKLLLFLEDRWVRPVGGTMTYPCNARLIFASGRPLKNCVHKKEMRSDFYYRLISGHTLNLSPLRDSPQKIEEFCYAYLNSKKSQISYRLLQFYKGQKWPGNYRQLKGHLEKKLAFSNGTKLDFCQLDNAIECGIEESLNGEESNFSTLEELRLRYCYQVYQRMGGSVSLASKTLGVTPNTLRSLLKKRVAA